jgi:hypothetical protein
VIWAASEREYKRQNHEAAHDEEFDRRNIELNLTWQTVTDIVESLEDDDEYGDPYSRVDTCMVEP